MTGSTRRLRRSERITMMMHHLLERPGELVSLGSFADRLQAARSTISEDLALMRETLAAQGLGRLETVIGPAGGVRYMPLRSVTQVEATLVRLSDALSTVDRMLPGGFLYMSDLVFHPHWAREVGDTFATAFADAPCDAVVTVETKGIPLAMMTARALGKPLVTCRRDSRITEGTAISITYMSGSNRTIQTMSLPKRALEQGSRVLFIDDFLKGGGTAKGIHDLMSEFNAAVVGTGVLVATRIPERKLVNDYLPLVVLGEMDVEARVIQAGPYQPLIEKLRHRTKEC